MRSRPTAESPATFTTSSEGVRIGPFPAGRTFASTGSLWLWLSMWHVPSRLRPGDRSDRAPAIRSNQAAPPTPGQAEVPKVRLSAGMTAVVRAACSGVVGQGSASAGSPFVGLAPEFCIARMPGASIVSAGGGVAESGSPATAAASREPLAAVTAHYRAYRGWLGEGTPWTLPDGRRRSAGSWPRYGTLGTTKRRPSSMTRATSARSGQARQPESSPSAATTRRPRLAPRRRRGDCGRRHGRIEGDLPGDGHWRVCGPRPRLADRSTSGW